MSLTRRDWLLAMAGCLLAAATQPFATISALAQGGDMVEQLLATAATGDLNGVDALLRAGVPLDGRDKSGRTALLVATLNNHPEIAGRLIEAGADVNAKDNIHDTPFLYAGSEGRNDILRLILASGRAKLDDSNRYGGTALIPAAHHGHPETVRMLIVAGVNVDHVNKLGWTALIEAVVLGDGGPTYQEIVRDLVAAGADVRIADNDGVTPLEHAKRRGFAQIAATIEGASAN